MTEYVRPDEIEKRSFEIIEAELLKSPEGGPRVLDPELAPVIMRVIHTTADFSFADSLRFSQGAVQRALEAIRKGASIVTDTNMAKAGINKTRLAEFGGSAHCFVADADVAEAAREMGTTRSSAAMDKAAALGGSLIFAIGNAPTALARLCRLVREGKITPELIIGVPVGFVNVVESKEELVGAFSPHIVAAGRRGGSAVAAAICNALIYMARG